MMSSLIWNWRRICIDGVSRSLLGGTYSVVKVDADIPDQKLDCQEVSLGTEARATSNDGSFSVITVPGSPRTFEFNAKELDQLASCQNEFAATHGECWGTVLLVWRWSSIYPYRLGIAPYLRAELARGREGVRNLSRGFRILDLPRCWTCSPNQDLSSVELIRQNQRIANEGFTSQSMKIRTM